MTYGGMSNKSFGPPGARTVPARGTVELGGPARATVGELLTLYAHRFTLVKGGADAELSRRCRRTSSSFGLRDDHRAHDDG